MFNPFAWIKKLLAEEPVILAWALNGGIAALFAYIFHFSHTQEAALATIVTALMALWSAAHSHPANVSQVKGALATICVAMAGFGLHLAANTEALVVAVGSLLVGLLIRANVSPGKV